ncbi:kinase-like protein [Exidia glandulosa HHB12029]|uniref:Kinase-like protein n=1 Tax=Exidia glandulosa HHB12029 TaxID=1314781 RepID=A0A165JJB7_EXIGL|nr:kinase-like protein [Exidia glandulosa HHB12029]
MASLSRFKAVLQRLFSSSGSPSTKDEPRGTPDITREIRRISLRPVGFGGYSDIYTGIWRSATGEMKVAIKVIRAVPMNAESNKMPRVLRREISVWKRLRHRNIHILCGLYEGIGPLPALVSPWCENADIKSYLERHGDNPNIELLKLRLSCDIICGLKFLHGNSVVHGDIKGQNVLISDAGVATLCDFGLSRILAEHSQSVTYTGVRGTSRWMAPEIFLDGERHSYESDMWACGCLFIEVWNNVLPYHTKINDFQLSLSFDAKEQPGSQLDMPDSIWAWVQDCCSFDVTQRPTASRIATRFCLQLVLQRVSRWVTLSCPIDAPERNLLEGVEASIQASASQGLTEMYILADSARL